MPKPWPTGEISAIDDSLGRRPVSTKGSLIDNPTACSPFCLTIRATDFEPAISVFKALEGRQKLGINAVGRHSGWPAKSQDGGTAGGLWPLMAQSEAPNCLAGSSCHHFDATAESVLYAANYKDIGVQLLKLAGYNVKWPG